LYTPEQLTAVKAAKAGYAKGLAAIDAALANPAKAGREPLEATGLGRKRLEAAMYEVEALRAAGQYRTGTVKVLEQTVGSVDLTLKRPEVTMTSCVDNSGTTFYSQKDNKPLPTDPGMPRRNSYWSKIELTAVPGQPAKVWTVVEEKLVGTC
jgi:hypothetical protein